MTPYERYLKDPNGYFQERNYKLEQENAELKQELGNQRAAKAILGLVLTIWAMIETFNFIF